MCPCAIDPLSLVGKDSPDHLHSGRGQHLTPTTGTQGGIGLGEDDSGDASLEQRLGAGPGSTDMSARFKGDHCRATASMCSGLLQGDDLGMHGAGSAMKALANDLAGNVEDDAAHSWIGRSRGHG